MIFSDFGLQIDERALKAAYQEAVASGNLEQFIAQPLGMFLVPIGEESEPSGVVVVLVRHLSTLGLSARAENCLVRYNGYEFLWQIVQKTDNEFLRMKNLGRGTLAEVKATLEQLGMPVKLARVIPSLVERAKAQTLPDSEDAQA